MGKDRVKDRVEVEWAIVEEAQAWQAGLSAPEMKTRADSEVSSRTASRGERQLTGLVVLLFLLLASGWVWYRQASRTRDENELQAAIVPPAKPSGAANAGYQSAQLLPVLSTRTKTTLPTAEMTAEMDDYHQQRNQIMAKIDDYHLQGDQAMVQVTMSYPAAQGKTVAYRETHFYRQTEQGWQRTESDPTLLGPWQTLKTAHFTVRYRSVDAVAVSEAAPKLERLYEKLRSDFGLSVAAITPETTVELVMESLLYGYTLNYATQTIQVRSPAMLSIPVEMTATEVLYQAAVYPLAALVLADMRDQEQVSEREKIAAFRWSPVIEALRLWALHEDGGPLASEWEEVIRWLYRNAMAESDAERRTLPQGYAHLCRIYRIWGIAPMEMGIPLDCSAADEHRWPPLQYPSMPTQLATRPYIEDVRGMADVALDNTIATKTVIDYVVAAYGRDHLPRIIAALDEHLIWHTLIPVVFGISADEFERDWRAYLANSYGDHAK